MDSFFLKMNDLSPFIVILSFRLRVYPMPFDGPEVVHMPPNRDNTMPAVFFINTRRPFER